jgi:RNA-directed DNA polymerase
MNYSNSNIKITTEIKRCYTVYWETIDWPAVHLTQTMIQQRLVETYRKQDIGAVYRLQHEILQNRNMRLCAVKRVTTSKGAKTPGIDNETLKEPYEKWAASIRLLQWAHSLDTYKAKPVRRVLIPKDNGESRPLGIPTIFDRLAQCMYYQIIDPIVEDTSDRNSYGFRARRSCGDVIQQLTLLLGSPTSAKWILDADVAKCFDRINHEAILENCIVFNKKPILQWLKAL